MINIIEPGYTGKRKRVYKLKCQNCECVYEFEIDDIQHTKVFKYPYILCPCCGKKASLDDDFLAFEYREVRVSSEEGEIKDER